MTMNDGASGRKSDSVILLEMPPPHILEPLRRLTGLDDPEAVIRKALGTLALMWGESDALD